MTKEAILPTVNVTPLSDRYLDYCEINRNGIADYLLERGLNDDEVVKATVNVNAYTPIVNGIKPMGEYKGDGNVHLYLPYIVVPRRIAHRPIAREIKNLSVEERLNYVLYHELEHYIEDTDDQTVIRSALEMEPIMYETERRMTRLKIATGAVAVAGLALEFNFTVDDLFTYLGTAVPAAVAGSYLYDLRKKMITRGAYYNYPHEIRAYQAGFDGLERGKLITATPVQNPRRRLTPAFGIV